MGNKDVSKLNFSDGTTILTTYSEVIYYLYLCNYYLESESDYTFSSDLSTGTLPPIIS